MTLCNTISLNYHLNNTNKNIKIFVNNLYILFCLRIFLFMIEILARLLCVLYHAVNISADVLTYQYVHELFYTNTSMVLLMKTMGMFVFTQICTTFSEEMLFVMRSKGISDSTSHLIDTLKNFCLLGTFSYLSFSKSSDLSPMTISILTIVYIVRKHLQ